MRRILGRACAIARVRKAATHKAHAAVAVVLTLVLVAVGGVATAMDGPGNRPPKHRPNPNLANDPTGRAASRAADKRADRRADRLRTPAARAARRRSRTAYRHLGRAAALRLARRSFGEVIEKPVWRGLEPGRGKSVRRYVDDFTAELDGGDGGEQPSVATSNLPFRTRDQAGRPVPVDLGLEPVGEAHVPRSPFVPTRIAKRARGGVTVGRRGLGIRPIGAGDVAGTVTEDRLFYPDVSGAAADTDLLIEPHELGARVMWQLRSAQSPERHALELELPHGATLRASAEVDGGAEIVQGEKQVALIEPPLAVDADGTPVRAAYEIGSDTLTVRVDHRDESLRYPLLVDPGFNVIEDFYDPNLTADPTDGGFAGWGRDGIGPGPNINDLWRWEEPGWALRVDSWKHVGYRVDDYAQRVYQAPRNAYIYRADFKGLTYEKWDPNQYGPGETPDWKSKLRHGLWKGPGLCCWEGDEAQHQDPSPDATKLNYDIPAICAAWDCTSGTGTEQNYAVHQLWVRKAGQGNTSAAIMRRAVLYLRDRYRPKVIATTHSDNLNAALGDGRWLGGGINLSSTPRGTDWGLGVARFDLINRQTERRIPVFGPEPKNPRWLECHMSVMSAENYDHDVPRSPQPDRGDRNHPCKFAKRGHDEDPPHDTWNDETDLSTFAYSTDELDEGVHTYGVDAFDVVGIKSDPPTSGWTLKVDRTKPDVSGKRGSLDGGSYIDPGPQTLDVDAVDVKPGGGPSSGVALVEAFYDNADDPNDALQPIASKPGNCTPSGCDQSLPGMHFDWNYSGTPRHLRITVKVRDQVGNTFETSWSVRRRPEPPKLEVRGGARLPLASGRNVELDGTDPDDGVQKFVVWVDPGDDPGDPHDDPDESTADHVKTYTCPCRPQEVESWALPENTAPGKHEILAKVYDPAGGTDEERWDAQVVTTLLAGERDKLGLEHWFQYDDTDAGGDSTVYVNAETGNTVWHSVPIVNPGRGLSAAVNLTYNSHDRGGVLGAALGKLPIVSADRGGLGNDEISELSYGEVGAGFSLAISGPTRLNEPLEGVLVAQAAEEGLEPTQVAQGLIPPAVFNPADVEIKLTDADGTRHVFTRSGDRWVAPPGVNMHLRRNRPGGTFATPVEDKWAMTRPDGVTHYFDSHGFLTATQDRNDNRLEYDYEYFDALSGDVVETVATGSGGTVDVELCDGVNTGAIELGEHATIHPPGQPGVNIPVYCAKRVKQVVLPAGAGVEGAARAERALRIDYVPHRSLVSGDAPPFRTQFPTVIGGNAGRIQRITDVKEREYEFGYDDEGFLTSFVEASNKGERRATSLVYEDYRGDPVNEVREDRQLTEIKESFGDDARRTVVRHAHPEDRAPEDTFIPRQACGVTKRDDGGLIGIDPEQGATGMCRHRSNNLEKTYSYVPNPGGSAAHEFGVDEVIHRSSSPEAPTPRATAFTRHQLDAEGRPIGLVDPLGRITRLEWNEAQNAVSAIEEAAFTDEAARIELDYDTEHRTGVIREKRTFPEFPDRDPTLTTRFDYQFSSGTQHSQVPSLASDDASGAFVADLTSISGPREGVGQSFAIEQRAGRYTGNVLRRYDRPNQQGNFASARYDDHGQVLSEDDEVPGNGITTYDDFHETGQPKNVKDPGNALWEYRYDDLGNLTSVIDPRATARNGGEDNAFTTTLRYDAFDRLLSEKVPKLSAGSDQAERFTTRSRSFDRNGNVRTVTDGEGSVTTIAYTAMDQPQRAEAPGRAGRPELTDYVYDDLDRLIARVSPKGPRPDATAVSSGQLDACAGQDPPPVVDHMTRYCLDEVGHRTAEIRTAADQATPLITSFDFDGRDNVVGLVDPERNDGRTVAEAVREAGDAGEDTTRRLTYEYDKLDRRTAQIEHLTELGPTGERVDPLRTEYGYDANGNRTSFLPPRAFAAPEDEREQFRTETSYDERDLVEAVRTPSGCTAYERREDGKVTATTSPRGTTGAPGNCADGAPFTHHTTRLTYDNRGDIATRSIPYAENQYGRADLEFAAWTVTYTRDDVGNPRRIKDARGNEFENTFYDSGELRSTERPSFFELDWGDEYATADPGHRFREQADIDFELRDGGPQLREAQERSRNAQRSDRDPELPESEGHGNFGEVEPSELGDFLPDAGTTTFSYDDEMRLTGIEDAANNDGAAGPDNDRTVSYDEAGRVTKKSWLYKPNTAQPAIEHTFEYDANGNLTEFKNGMDHVTRFESDGYDRRVTESTPGAAPSRGATIEPEDAAFEYDLNGNLTRRVTPRGESFDFRFGHDSADRLVSETNPADETWSYGYDPNGNVAFERSPRWHAAAEDVRGDFETTFTYDASDRLTQTDRGLGSEFRVKFGYDADGNATSVETPGAASSHGSSAERRLQTTEHDGRGLPWRVTTSTNDGGDRRRTLKEYDPNGNLRRAVDGKGITDAGLPKVGFTPQTDVDQATWHATVRQYDADDQLTEVRLPWGKPGGETVVDDPAGPGTAEKGGDDRRFVQSFVRAGDPLKRVTSIVSPHEPADAKAPRTSYTYFANGWLATQSDEKVVQTAGGEPVETTRVTYNYDRTGNQTSWRTKSFESLDPKGREVVRKFYPNGTLRSRTAYKPQPSGDGDCEDEDEPEPDRGADCVSVRSYQYFYNPNRSLTRIEDHDSDLREPGAPPPSGEPDRTTDIVRDSAERERAVDETWSGGRDTLFVYDPNGNVTERHTDGDYSSGGPTDFYSGAERKTTTFEYDALDRETEMTVDPAEGDDRTTITNWWPSGQIRERIKSNGTVESLFFTPRGELAEKRRDPEQGDPDTQDYDYDRNGRRTEDERGDHVFNPRGELVEWRRGSKYASTDPTKDKEGTLVTYERNGRGDVTKEVDRLKTGMGGTVTTTFRYQGERLQWSKAVGAAGAGTHSDYFYDDFGSVTKIKRRPTGGAVDPLDPPDGPQPPTSCVELPEDAVQDVTRYCFDEFERMIASRGVEGPANYVYDGLDRRDRKTVLEDGQAKGHDYSYIGLSELLSRETDKDGKKKSYDYDSDGRRLGQSIKKPTDDQSAHRPYASDANGSVEGLEESDGQLGTGSDDTYLYDPYGEPENVGAASERADPGLSDKLKDNPFRFEGFYYDSGVKTYDMRARSYRPDIGRFMSQDRFEAAVGDQLLQADPLTQNRYAFAGGNPINNVEFDGHHTQRCLSADHCTGQHSHWKEHQKNKNRNGGGGGGTGTAVSTTLGPGSNNLWAGGTKPPPPPPPPPPDLRSKDFWTRHIIQNARKHTGGFGDWVGGSLCSGGPSPACLLAKKLGADPSTTMFGEGTWTTIGVGAIGTGGLSAVATGARASAVAVGAGARSVVVGSADDVARTSAVRSAPAADAARGAETVATTGQRHHVISTRIGRAIGRHPTLSGQYSQRDPRFITQAVDDAAHRGYQSWHRELDAEIEHWLLRNPSATPRQFEQHLRRRYSQPDLRKRFPNGF